MAIHWHTVDKIKRLEAKYKQAKSIIGKRNSQMQVLRRKMYDVNFVFRLFVALRKLDDKIFSDSFRDINFIIDYFILQGVQYMETFQIPDAQKIVDEIPALFRERAGQVHGVDARIRLNTMEQRKLVRHYTFRGNQKYHITSDGKWYLMQTVKEMRDLFTGVLKEETRYERKVKWNDKRRI